MKQINADINGYKIKEAEITDIKDFLELEVMCFQSDLINEKEYRRLFQRSNAKIFGIWFQDQLIACAVIIMKMHRSKCRLYNFCVRKEYQQQGLANALLNSIQQYCAALRIKMLYLEVSEKNENACKFYQLNGFEPFGIYEKYYEDGANAVRMRKDLNLVNLPWGKRWKTKP